MADGYPYKDRENNAKPYMRVGRNQYREFERICQLTMESVPEDIAILNEDKLIYANCSICQTLDYTRAEMAHKGYLHWIAPEFRKSVASAISKVLRTEESRFKMDGDLGRIR